MSHTFDLRPNQALLSKYGYNFISSLEIDSIWEEEKRQEVERGFKTLIRKYHIDEHYDTLLYLCLVESNNADIQFQHKFESYVHYKRIKEIAKFLLMYRAEERHRPFDLKVSSVVSTIKLTDPILVEWIGILLKNAIESQDFNPVTIGQELFNFTANDDGHIIAGKQLLNYTNIEYYANQNLRKPGRRERNKVLVPFLLKVLTYLNNETILKASTGVRYAAGQLNFLFEVALILEWLEPDTIESDSKDYIYTLLSNHKPI